MPASTTKKQPAKKPRAVASKPAPEITAQVKAAMASLEEMRTPHDFDNLASVTLARRLSEAPESAARWIGRDAHKELTSSAVLGRLAARKLRLGDG